MNPNAFGYMGPSSTYKTGLSHLVQRPLSNYQSHQNAGTVDHTIPSSFHITIRNQFI